MTGQYWEKKDNNGKDRTIMEKRVDQYWKRRSSYFLTSWVWI